MTIVGIMLITGGIKGWIDNFTHELYPYKKLKYGNYRN